MEDYLNEEKMGALSLMALQKKRILSFKLFIEQNLAHIPKIKELLTEMSNHDISTFIGIVEQVLIPHRLDFKVLIKKLCVDLGIDIEVIPTEVIEKLCRYLEYFCDFIDELKR